MSDASINTTSVAKRPKIKASHRREQILALQLAGRTQEQIAQALGVDRRTIVRDLQEMRPSQDAVNELLTRAQKRIAERMPIEARIDKYVDHAKSAKNEAVSLGALQRIDDLDGIVTDKERLRAKQAGDQQANRPIFVFQGGMNIDFGGGNKPQDTTTYRKAPLDNGASAVHNQSSDEVMDITPTESSE